MPEGYKASDFVWSAFVNLTDSVTDKIALIGYIVTTFMFHFALVWMNFKLAIKMPEYNDFVLENITHENPELKRNTMKFVFKMVNTYVVFISTVMSGHCVMTLL